MAELLVLLACVVVLGLVLFEYWFKELGGLANIGLI